MLQAFLLHPGTMFTARSHCLLPPILSPGRDSAAASLMPGTKQMLNKWLMNWNASQSTATVETTAKWSYFCWEKKWHNDTIFEKYQWSGYKIPL